MKVEKCPLCDAKPLSYTINSVNGSRISVWERACPICEHSEVAITWRGAIRKWNRWARREAKRIAKQEANRLMLMPDNTAICPKCFGTMFHEEWHYVCERCGKRIKEGATK